MLFDLRGRGRRRTIQVIYLGARHPHGRRPGAVRIGGNVSGGLLDAFNSDSPARELDDDLQEAHRRGREARSRRRPPTRRPGPTLARARFQQAAATSFDPNRRLHREGQRTSCADGAAAWDRYLALNREARRRARDADGPGLRAWRAREVPTRPWRRWRSSSSTRDHVDRALRAARDAAPTWPGRTARATSRARRPSRSRPRTTAQQVKAQLDSAKAQAAQAAAQQAQQQTTG